MPFSITITKIEYLFDIMLNSKIDNIIPQIFPKVNKIISNNTSYFITIE